MNIKKIVICLSLLMFAGFILSPLCLAEGNEGIDVKRHVPSDLSKGKTAEITLEITGETPFMVGIVEIIPEGFEFPETDEEVSDAEHFKVDRNNGKIAFSVKDESEITYNVIPSGNDENAFEGYWVDMLFQTQQLNEGKERWISVTDPNAVSNSQNSASGTASALEDTGDSAVSKAPGFGAFLASVSLVAGLFVLRKHDSGDDQQ